MAIPIFLSSGTLCLRTVFVISNPAEFECEFARNDGGTDAGTGPRWRISVLGRGQQGLYHADSPASMQATPASSNPHRTPNSCLAVVRIACPNAGPDNPSCRCNSCDPEHHMGWLGQVVLHAGRRCVTMPWVSERRGGEQRHGLAGQQAADEDLFHSDWLLKIAAEFGAGGYSAVSRYRPCSTI